MQENWFQLIQHFNVNDAFVLATICATRGSTYQKTGTMMLISAEGSCTGLLSGGCLEADISLHAQQVLIDNKTISIKNIFFVIFGPIIKLIISFIYYCRSSSM